jgi:hypothetical protein
MAWVLKRAIILVGASMLVTLASVFAVPRGTVGKAQDVVPSFSDVSSISQHFVPIIELSKQGVVTGHDDGSFQPNKIISRAEATALILRTIDDYESIDKPAKFSDVSSAAWYPDGTFRPLDELRFNEAAKLIFEALDVRIDAANDEEEWWEPYTEYISTKNLAEPDIATNEYPTIRNITRGEFAALLYRTQQIKNNNYAKYKNQKEWLLYQQPVNYYAMRHPRTWKVFRGTNHSAVWLEDEGQKWLTRIFPKSMRISISFEERGTCTQKREHNKDIRTVDATLCLKPGNVLTVYGDYGSAVNHDFAYTQLNAIIDTIHTIEKPAEPEPKGPTPENLAEAARAAILVDGEGARILELFKDESLIETDAIGVGTGPIDYFYSASSNITIKYERSSYTILDVRNDETTQF